MALTDQSESMPRLSVKTVRIPSGIASDPLSWFPDKSSKDICWFWEIPEDKTSWLGIGETESITLEGPTRFSEANKHFRKIVNLIDWEAPMTPHHHVLQPGFHSMKTVKPMTGNS